MSRDQNSAKIIRVLGRNNPYGEKESVNDTNK
jgi:hypothetical protein